MNSPECWRWIFLFCSSSQWRCPCSAPALAVIAPVPWVASSYLKQLNYWLSLCDRGGVKSLGTLSWGQMQTRPKQSLIPPHVLTRSSTYHSITHWIPSCLGCQFASHYSLSRDFRFLTWCVQFTIQRMSNLALHFAGFLLSEKEEYCFKQLQTATLAP